MDTFVYNAHVDKVYDGDTITCSIDCGFGIIMKKQKIRLYGIDCKEVRGAEREEGLIARDKLRELILNKDIVLKTVKDKKGKYGRYLGIVYHENTNINDWLVENKYADRVNY